MRLLVLRLQVGIIILKFKNQFQTITYIYKIVIKKVIKKVSKQVDVNQYLFNKLKREKAGKNLNKDFKINSKIFYLKIRKKEFNLKNKFKKKNKIYLLDQHLLINFFKVLTQYHQNKSKRKLIISYYLIDLALPYIRLKRTWNFLIKIVKWNKHNWQ